MTGRCCNTACPPTRPLGICFFRLSKYGAWRLNSNYRLNPWTSHSAMPSLIPPEGFLDQSLRMGQPCSNTICCFVTKASVRLLQSFMPLLSPEQVEPPLLESCWYNEAGAVTPLLQQSVSLLSAACSDLQKATFNIMFHPISCQLELVPGLELWAAQTTGEGTMESSTLPDFSFSPGEYITCVGEYLMTLPQHLEPYMSQDNVALCRAFRCVQRGRVS